MIVCACFDFTEDMTSRTSGTLAIQPAKNETQAHDTDSPVIGGIRTGSYAAERVLSGNYTAAIERINHYFAEDGTKAGASSMDGTPAAKLKPLMPHAISSALHEPDLSASLPTSPATAVSHPVLVSPESFRVAATATADDAAPKHTADDIKPQPKMTTPSVSPVPPAGGLVPRPPPTTPPSRRKSVENTVILATPAKEGAESPAMTASQAIRAGDFDIRTYVPRSGSSGLRFSEALRHHRQTLHEDAMKQKFDEEVPLEDDIDEAPPQSVPLKAAPKAPVALPKAAATPLRDLTPAQVKDRQTRIRVENLRCIKWREMFAEWDEWNANSSKREKLKNRCRKGIPEPVRCAAWFRIARADKAKLKEPTLYDSLLSLPITDSKTREPSATTLHEHAHLLREPSARDIHTANGKASLGGATTEIIDTIERDINRTFPHYSMFSEVGGVGQTALFRILVAYAQYDRKVGYCQGMGFLAAMFLSYMPEVDAFYMFKSVLQEEPWKLCELYAPGLPKVGLLEHTLQGLMNTRLHKLAAHFHSFLLHPTMFSAQWFLTIFTYNFPFPVVVRVWDAFLFEGWKVMFRVGLAALKLHEAAFLRCKSFEEVMGAFRELPGSLDPDSLITEAFALSLSHKEIDALQAEYQQLSARGLPSCTAFAGRGVAAHEKAFATTKRK